MVAAATLLLRAILVPDTLDADAPIRGAYPVLGAVFRILARDRSATFALTAFPVTRRVGQLQRIHLIDETIREGRPVHGELLGVRVTRS